MIMSTKLLLVCFINPTIQSAVLLSFVGSLVDRTQQKEVEDQFLFFSSSGRIGTIFGIDDSLALSLSALQRNMAGVLKGPGDYDHTAYVSQY